MLHQLRTLDFGTGPWANYAVVHVYHPDNGNPFVSLSFPGFVGAITGFSTKIAISEKVWETYVNGGVQPGNYNGMPDALVLRELLQFANSRNDAIALTERVKRNWAMFVLPPRHTHTCMRPTDFIILVDSLAWVMGWSKSFLPLAIVSRTFRSSAPRT